MKRHGSSISLQSNTFSTASGSSFERTGRNLREKLAEMETFKDILCTQIDTLQEYFNSCSESAPELSSVTDGKSNSAQLIESFFERQFSLCAAIDFKGEAITFRTTTQAVLATLAHCIDLMVQREDVWRKKFDKETERRKHFENLSKTYFEKLNARSIHPGPDLEVSHERYLCRSTLKLVKLIWYFYYCSINFYFVSPARINLSNFNQVAQSQVTFRPMQ